mgnify:CR=1 FL=1
MAKKTTKKAAAPKKATAKKATAKTTAKKAAAPKKAAKVEKAAGSIKVTQIGSPISRHPDQRKTLIGLGLNKMHRTRVLQDTPAIRGMINKVSHLIKVEDAA